MAPVGIPGVTAVAGDDVAAGDAAAGVAVVTGLTLFTAALAAVFEGEFADCVLLLALGGVGCVVTPEKPAAPVFERSLLLKNKNKAQSAKTDITTNLAVFFIIRLLELQIDLMSIISVSHVSTSRRVL